MKTYHISRAGRRTLAILLVGALIIWAFAIWTFRSTVQASLMQGPTLGQVVPALLMLVLVVATPFVIWNLLEEWSAVYTVTDDGLRYQSLGIDMLIPWSAISATRRIDVEAEESADELLLHEDPTPQISNPLLRMLHVQAYGRRKLAIYAGVEQRDELLAAITRRSVEGSPAAMPVPVSASTDA